MITVQRLDRRRPPQLGVSVRVLQDVMGVSAWISGPRWDSKLLTVYRLAAGGKKEEALDLIFQGVDKLLCEHRFDECDALLQDVDLTHLDSSLIVGFLNATLPARPQLQKRAAFVERAATSLRRLRGDEVAERLIQRHREG